MKRNVLVGLGALTAVVLVGVVFVLGRATASKTTDTLAATTTTTTSVPATTTTEPPPTTTTTMPATIGDANAVAGVDQLISVTDEVTLDGSESSDPDAAPLEYVWAQTHGPDVTGGTGSLEGEAPIFTAPGSVSTLVFELTVDDGEASDPDTVVVQVVEDADSAVFVDEDADVTGVGRGTIEDPFTTIAAAAALGEAEGGADLYLKTPEDGEFTVGSDGLELPPNVSIYGGYGSEWFRDPSEPTLVTGPGRTMEVAVDGLFTVISGIELRGGASDIWSLALDIYTDEADGGEVRIEDSIITAGAASQSSVGVKADGAFDLTIVRSSISGGLAGTGIDGDAALPQDGTAAKAGKKADDRDGGGGYNPGGDGGSALAGKGKNGSGDPTSLGGTGGKANKNGGKGDQLGGVGGGIGGAGGSRDLGSGQGEPGSDGFHGREGGGGGGGGGVVGLAGGGGGGGGEGGKPGLGGAGGHRGDASVGLYVELMGELVIENSEIHGGTAGMGGTGGVGSSGKPGAKAGAGAKGSCSFLGCGAGQAGNGGDGAGGGAGSQGGQGGGGAGGFSTAIMIISPDTVLTLIDSKILGGAGGQGGAGGIGGLSSEGGSGRNPGVAMVPDSEATAVHPGADGGSSFGLVLGPSVEESQVTSQGTTIGGGTAGDPGDAPIPGQHGLSEPIGSFE